MDYRSVRPDLGTVDDLRDLATTLRGEGISLCLDLVLNHVAREHEWALAARAGDPDRRASSTSSRPRRCPTPTRRRCRRCSPTSRRAASPGTTSCGLGLDDVQRLPVGPRLVEPRRPPRVRRHHPVAGQPGRGGVPPRRDRVLWKRLGTDCQNQPEVHDLTRALRTVARIAAPRSCSRPRRSSARRTSRPTSAWVSSGPGQRPRLPQRADGAGLVDARLARRPPGDVRPPAAAAAAVDDGLDHLRALPRRHRVGDLRRGRPAVGLDAAAHRRFLSDFYAGSFPGSWARGLVFQHNEQTGDRRISGSLASLAGLEVGDPRRRRAHPARARDHPVLRRPAGDLDGRRGRAAQRPGGPTTPTTPPTTGGCTGRGCPGPTSRPTPTRTASRRACGT